MCTHDIYRHTLFHTHIYIDREIERCAMSQSCCFRWLLELILLDIDLLETNKSRPD